VKNKINHSNNILMKEYSTENAVNTANDGAASNPISDKTDAQRMGLKGNVKSVLTALFTARHKYGIVEKKQFLNPNDGNTYPLDAHYTARIFFMLPEYQLYNTDGSFFFSDEVTRNGICMGDVQQHGAWEDCDKLHEMYKYLEVNNGNKNIQYLCHYDNNFNCIEMTSYEVSSYPVKQHEQMIATWKYKYNEKGDIVALFEWYRDRMPVKYTYEYKYDEQGNWVQVIEYEHGIATFIADREIEYY
jgi:hypothetical protein